jgi:hypothetical protein
MDGLLGNPRANIYESPPGQAKDTLPLELKLWYNPSGENRSCSTPLHRMATPLPQTASSRRKPCDPTTCLPTSKLLDAPGSRLHPPSLQSGFVAQPSNSTVFWWTTANPACRLRSWAATLHRLLPMTSSCFSCHHAAHTWPRWPLGPSSKPTCLSTPRRPRKA